MAVRELNTDPQNNERPGHVQNMWVNVAGTKWHLSHSGPMVGSIRASLHCDLNSFSNYFIKSCVIVILTHICFTYLYNHSRIVSKLHV